MHTGLPMTELTLGESIAVNGVCLTVTSFGEGSFTPTFHRKPLTVPLWVVCRAVHASILRRALRLSDRLGGHLVSGHVDGLAKITELHRDGNAWRFTFQAEAAVIDFLVAKGSVAIDGISLTVNDVAERLVLPGDYPSHVI